MIQQFLDGEGCDDLKAIEYKPKLSNETSIQEEATSKGLPQKSC